jgi:hypothetical protein
VWHEVPPNDMPLEAYTDAQLADLKYSKDGGLSLEQRAAVDEELHDRAIDAGEKVGPGVPQEVDTADEPDGAENLAPEWIDVVATDNTPGPLDPFSEAEALWGAANAAEEPVVPANQNSPADDILVDDARMFEPAEDNGATPVATGTDAVIHEETVDVPDQPLVTDPVMQDAPALQEPIVEEEYTGGFDEIETAPSSSANSALIDATTNQDTEEYYPDLG